jgi:hypothetical protein
MLAVLTLLTITRTLDSYAWLPPSPDKTKRILLNYLFEFMALVSGLIVLMRNIIKDKVLSLLRFRMLKLQMQN